MGNGRIAKWEKIVGPNQAALLRRLPLKGKPGFVLSGPELLSARALVRKHLAEVVAVTADVSGYTLSEFGQMVLRGTGTLSRERSAW